MAGQYNGIVAEFDREMDMIAGLANLRMLWDVSRHRLRLGF